MDEKTCEDGDQNVSVNETNRSIDKSTTAFTVPHSPQKEVISGDQTSDGNVVCITLEKADEYLKGKSKEEGIKLQERHHIIVEFFTCFTSSLRLLSMRDKLSTFDNISRQVSVMAKRKFLHKHLAQIVYIIPEAVKFDEVMVHDKKTLCMKPEMIVSLQFDIVEGHSEHSDFLALRRVFSSRVTEYFVIYPEKSEVPEGALPEPFNQSNIMFSIDQCSDHSSEKSQPTSGETNLSFAEKALSKAEIPKPVASSVVGSPSTPACSLKEKDNNDNLLEDFPAQSMTPRAAANSSDSVLDLQEIDIDTKLKYVHAPEAENPCKSFILPKVVCSCPV